jgi:hypothetical protein
MEQGTHMNSYRVTVIDGDEAPDFSRVVEPDFVPDPELRDVVSELMRREPLFHRAEVGISRADFEKTLAPEFWETGASGRRYCRQFVLDSLEARYKKTVERVWEIADFHGAKIAVDNYLITYTLRQGDRVTRRATLWRKISSGWQAVYHQGTLVAGNA